MTNKLFECKFISTVPYQEYQGSDYDHLHDTILELCSSLDMFSVLVNAVYEPIEKIDKNWDWVLAAYSDFHKEFGASRERTYLVFQIFACEQNLYIDADSITKERWEFKKFSVFDMKSLDKEISGGDVIPYMKNVSFITPLVNIKEFFSRYQEADEVQEIYRDKWKRIEVLEKYLKDIKEIPNIADEFKHCQILTTMKHWKIKEMAAIASTQKLDIQEWEEKLWADREIKSSTRDDHDTHLEVTKIHKYGKE